jgi:hypothetical protein
MIWGARPWNSAVVGKATLCSSVQAVARLGRPDDAGPMGMVGELGVAQGLGRSSGSVGSGANEKQWVSEWTATSPALDNQRMAAVAQRGGSAPATSTSEQLCGTLPHRDRWLAALGHQAGGAGGGGGSVPWPLGRGSAVAARLEHDTVLRRVRGELIESSWCDAWQQQSTWTPHGRRHQTSGSHMAAAAGSMAGGPHTIIFPETQINL